VLDRVNEPIEPDGTETGSYVERLQREKHVRIFYDRVHDCAPALRPTRWLYPSLGRFLDNCFQRSKSLHLRKWVRLLDLVISLRCNHKKLVSVDSGSKALISSFNWCDTDSLNSNSGVLFTGEAAREAFDSQLREVKGLEKDFRSNNTLPPSRKERRYALRGAPLKGTFLKYVDSLHLKRAALQFFEAIEGGDRVELVFNFFHNPRLHRIIRKKAAEGARFRILLDEKSRYFFLHCPYLLNYLTWKELHSVPNVAIRFVRNQKDYGENHEAAALIHKRKSRHSLAWVGSTQLSSHQLDRLSFRDAALLVADGDQVGEYGAYFEKLWRSEQSYSLQSFPNWFYPYYATLFNWAVKSLIM